MNMTKDQLDAIAKAKRERKELQSLKALEIAEKLKAEKHPLFGGPATAATPAKTATAMLEIDPGPPPGAAPPPAPVTKVEDVRSGQTAEIVLRPEERAEIAKAAASSPRLLPAAFDVPEGAEELDASDMVIPTLVLKQAQTKGIPDGIKIPDGHWFLKQNPNVASGVRQIVVLHIGKGRSFMLPYSKTQRPEAAKRVKEVTGVEVSIEREKPICFSSDRATPVKQEDIATLARSCAECGFAKWRTIAGKPVMDCSESYHLLVADRTDGDPGMPSWLHLRGAAIKPAKNFFTALKFAALTTKIDGKPAPFYAFAVELTSVDRKSDEGNYAIPQFGQPTLLEDQDLLGFYAAVRASALASQERGGEVPE